MYGSELHATLGVKSNYREWSVRRFADCDAVENLDFQGVEISTPSGQHKIDHIILLDTAKEMAMLERNEKGKEVRRYFIEVEKRYKSIQEKPMPIVHIEEVGNDLPAKYPTLQSLLARAEGSYPNGGPSEGIVIRTIVPMFCPLISGPLSMKVINNKYLLKK